MAIPLALKLRFFKIFVLLLGLVIAAGCSRANDPATLGQSVSGTAATSATATSTPRPAPTTTPTPEPTPILPGVVIADQMLDESGILVADQVTLPGPGWLAIYRVVDGEAGEVIGQTPLAAGVHENVEVVVNTDLATDHLFAGVHMDVGAEGVFEFPGEDVPYPGEPEMGFAVELLLPQPNVEVTEQAVADDGMLTLARVELTEPTWILIHAESSDDEIGTVIGGILLQPGIHENVPIYIDWRRATPVLYAVLHEDDGQAGILDYPDGDMPILKNGEPVVAAFKATYPPEVLVYDQPVIDGAITIERAISNGPGWVAIYNEAEGQPGLIIGSAPLADGLNERITIPLVQSAITPQLFARLHQDTVPGDAFNFPGQDPPVLFNNRMPTAAAFRTDIGAHVFINDQRLGDGNSLTVSAIVSPVPAWAAIYDDDEGQPGALLGQTWIPAGINRDVQVEVDPIPDAGNLFLVMYEDVGIPREFDVPDSDAALTNDDNRPIRIPFALQPPAGE